MPLPAHTTRTLVHPARAPARTLPGLAGLEPVNGRLGGYDEGPQGEEIGRIYHLKDWARWDHPKRVAWLRDNFVNEYGADIRMRLIASTILRQAGVEDRDYPAMARALLQWVQRNIQYTEEFDEQLQSPWRTLQYGTGDCDDIAALLATLAASVNLPCRFVLAGSVPGQAQYARWVEGSGRPPKGTWFHIYCEFSWPAAAPVVWASAEPTFTRAPLGYDMALHGVLVDAHGRPSVPERIRQEGRSGIWWQGLRSPNLEHGKPKPGSSHIVTGPMAGGGQAIGGLGRMGSAMGARGRWRAVAQVAMALGLSYGAYVLWQGKGKEAR